MEAVPDPLRGDPAPGAGHAGAPEVGNASSHGGHPLLPQIREFRLYAEALELTRDEELALLQIDDEIWSPWRDLSVVAGTQAPGPLARRLDYALGLMRRMVQSATSA